MQFIVNKYWGCHVVGYLQGDGTILSICEALLFIIGFSLDDVVGEDDHRYTNAQEYDCHDVEQSYCFG